MFQQYLLGNLSGESGALQACLLYAIVSALASVSRRLLGLPGINRIMVWDTLDHPSHENETLQIGHRGP
jgi:hypothetical protein